MENFKFGIIGAGNIAATFCDGVSRVYGAEVTAVASKTKGKAEAFAKKYSIKDYYSNYEDMLNDKSISAVYIATTHNFHCENAMLALNHGKHVLCEKCFATTAEDAKKVFALAREKGLFCMEATWSLFLPAINKAKEWIAKGKIGNIQYSTFTIGFKSSEDENGRMRNKQLAGGAMFDIGVYAIEITDYLIAKPLRSVKSSVSYFENGCDSSDSIILNYEGCTASLNAVITCNVKDEMIIYGDKGRIEIRNPHFANSCILYGENGIEDCFYSYRANGFEYETAAFINDATGGAAESRVLPHSLTIKAAEIFDECFAQNKHA